MITDKSKTPIEIFIQENMGQKMYGVNQDESIDGMVKYIRSDFVPNDEEMLAFAEKESFWLDDRLCPYSREELRSRAWLEGYRFAKRHQEIMIRNVYNFVHSSEEPIEETNEFIDKKNETE